GHGSAEAEARHSDAVPARPRQRARVREAALEILYVARGSRLAENPGIRVEVVLGGPAFAREQVHGEPDVTGLCNAPRDVLDVAREAVLVADEHDGVACRARGPREVSVEPHAFSGKFGDSGDDRGIV